MELIPISSTDLLRFKADMQEAFQKGFEEHFGKTEEIILSEKDIDQSLKTNGAIAYKAMSDDVMIGGAIVVIDEETHHNHLHFLFVKNGAQVKGVGKSIWFQIEKLHKNTKIWETCTPYFEQRNIHFYVNVCGFHIVAFYNKMFPMPDAPEEFIGDGYEWMFVFQKVMSLV